MKPWLLAAALSCLASVVSPPSPAAPPAGPLASLQFPQQGEFTPTLEPLSGHLFGPKALPVALYLMSPPHLRLLASSCPPHISPHTLLMSYPNYSQSQPCVHDLHNAVLNVKLLIYLSTCLLSVCPQRKVSGAQCFSFPSTVNSAYSLAPRPLMNEQKTVMVSERLPL